MKQCTVGTKGSHGTPQENNTEKYRAPWQHTTALMIVG